MHEPKAVVNYAVEATCRK